MALASFRPVLPLFQETLQGYFFPFWIRREPWLLESFMKTKDKTDFISDV